MEVEDVDHLVRAPRGTPWALIGLAGVALAAAGVIGWFVFMDGDPPAYRVLVAAPGLDAAAAEAFESEVREPLAGGFELVRLADGARPADAAAVAARAAEERAAHAVVLTLEPIEERDAEGLDRAFAHVRLGASVGGDAVPEVEVAAHAASLAEARRAAVERGARAIADAVHLTLLERPEVGAFVEDTDVRVALLERQSALRDQLTRVETARQARARFDAHCAEGAEALDRDATGREGGCLSGGCDEHYAFGALPDGTAALVHTETPGVRIALDESNGIPRRVETAEHLAVVPLDGSPPRSFATASNYYTYPTVSEDGATVVAVEDWGNGFGLVAIDVASSERRLLSSFTGYPQAPSISPDGAFVLLRHRHRRRAEPQAVVLPLEPNAALTRLGAAELAEWASLALEPGAAPTLGLVERVPLDAVLPPGEPVADELADADEEGLLPRLFSTDRIALLSPTDASVLAWLDDDRHRVRRLVGSRDGALVFTWDNRGACGLGWWRPADATADGGSALRTVTTEACLDQARLAPDGAVLGVARVSLRSDLSPADLEVVRVDPATGALTILTANDQRERYPRAAGPDRAVFDRVGERRYRPFPRVATCWVDARPE